MPIRYRDTTPTTFAEEWSARAYPFLPSTDPDQERIAEAQAALVLSGELTNYVKTPLLEAAIERVKERMSE